MAKRDAVQLGGFLTGRRSAFAEVPTLTERPGAALLEIHAAVQARNPAQHSHAAHKNREED